MRVPCGSGSRGMSEEFESQVKDISVFFLWSKYILMQ